MEESSRRERARPSFDVVTSLAKFFGCRHGKNEEDQRH